MAKDRLSGRLVVILHADIAASTMLVQQDKGLAHERIQHSFRRLGDSIAAYDGRVLEIRGDALLASFDHASDAVSAALAFQASQSDYIEQLQDDVKPRVRIGVSIGEVIVADKTVTGAGVVQAQRIEQLAAPGGVCISAAIHEALSRQMPFDFEMLGEQVLKGFDHPVHVYRISLQPGTSVPPPGPARANRLAGSRRISIVIAAVLLVLIAAASLLWLRTVDREDGTVVAQQAETAEPGKPSIAVLPFTNMSSDPEQDYFTDGMTEDLITDLSRLSGLFVISRNTVFTYKHTAVNIARVAEELGVRYVLEGSVRRAGNQVRINAQLIDSKSDAHVWAERYDGTLEDIFALQDQVTNRIVASLAIELSQGEQDRISSRETEITEAYDSFLKGWEQYLRQTPESYRKAITIFERAIELDPGYSRAYAALSLTYWQAYKSYWHDEMGSITLHDLLFRAEKYLAMAMDEPTPLALQISAGMLAQWGRYDEAIAEGKRAIAMDPNDANGYVALAGALNLAGQPSEALPLMEKAVRLNPHYPTSYLYELGLARFGLEDFEKALIILRQAVTLNPDDRWSSRLLIATLGHLNRPAEAATFIDKTNQNFKGFDPLSVRGVTFWYPFKEPADTERLAEGLRKAGVPD